MNWDNSFSVNVAEIDLQHQTLLSMVNELSDAMKQGQGNDVLGNIVSGLINYAETHFKTEEKYFNQFGYPDSAAHIQEHTAFVQKISDFKDGFEQGKLLLSIEIMNFLSDWLQNHIKGSDKKFGPFLTAKGVQ